MSMRTALMEMAKPKTERAAWVPESILDDDVSHFMGAAAAAKKAGKSHFDFGGKKYKVTMKHDTAKKVDESAECPTCGDGECQCEQPVQEAKVDEVSYKTAMRSYQKAMGQSKDADDAGDKKTGDKKFDQAVKFGRYANKKFQSSRNKKKLVGTLSRQVPLGTLTKEETVEEAKVDELSKKTYKSYFKKADLSQRDAERKLKDVRSKRDIFAKPGGQERKLINTIKKRNRGMDDARDRIANKESVEEAKINELSKGTLDRYRQVAYNDRIRQSGNRQKGEDDTPGMKKRDAGIALATKKSNAKGPGFEPKSRPGGDVLKFKSKKESVEVEENYTDKQDASYRDEPTPKGAQKRLKALHKKALAYRKKHGVFPSVRKKQKDLAMKKGKSDLKFESVEEATKATAQHKPTAETSDTWDKQLATRKGEKEFIDKHEMDVALDAEKMYDQNKYEAMKKTPARNGDKTDGDKKVVNPLSTDMVTGMRKALAQMKLSGE